MTGATGPPVGRTVAVVALSLRPTANRLLASRTRYAGLLAPANGSPTGGSSFRLSGSHVSKSARRMARTVPTPFDVAFVVEKPCNPCIGRSRCGRIARSPANGSVPVSPREPSDPAVDGRAADCDRALRKQVATVAGIGPTSAGRQDHASGEPVTPDRIARGPATSSTASRSRCSLGNATDPSIASSGPRANPAWRTRVHLRVRALAYGCLRSADAQATFKRRPLPAGSRPSTASTTASERIRSRARFA